MGLLKKNLSFTIVVGICLLVFCAGAYMTFAESGKISSAKQKITSAESRLSGLRYAEPAPTEENVEASLKNVAELQAQLEKIRDNLQEGARLTASSDGISVMASVQQYISDSKRRAASHKDEDGEPAEIELPKDFAFGFGLYSDKATPPTSEKAPILDKQRQILSYLVEQLYAADPKSLVSIEREWLEVEASEDERGSAKNGFTISDAATARVPGAIDTMAFSITFTGYTDSLRVFLNNLAQFDLPIVVRSIETKRPVASKAKPVAKPQDVESIFGAAFGGGSPAEVEKAQEEARKPVIEDNISTFTVILEYIDIILPSESEEENV